MIDPSRIHAEQAKAVVAEAECAFASVGLSVTLSRVFTLWPIRLGCAQKALEGCMRTGNHLRPVACRCVLFEL